MSDTAIRIENLSKVYRIGLAEEAPQTLFEAGMGLLKAPIRNFRRLRRLNTFRDKSYDEAADLLWALRDINFEVKRGEVVGIIGRNGAGKSTLLKILSRITEPTTGRIRMRGRVSALLEVGTGFHPELTGRENVYLNGTILGMRKREVDRKFDDIVEFSGVGRFLDTPVKRYSSGMKVRLAFSVAAHLEPEILIVDEVLAVGDAAFQQKCLGKMQDVSQGEGRTVLFVSHNMASVQALCGRVIVLDGGRMVFDGEPGDGVRTYLRTLTPPEAAMQLPLSERTDRQGRGGVRLTEVSVRANGGADAVLPMGEAVEIDIGYTCERTFPNLCFGLIVRDRHFSQLFHFNSEQTHGAVPGSPGEGRLTCRLESLPLLPGRYSLGAYVRRADESGNDAMMDYVRQVTLLEVLPRDIYGTGKIPQQGQCFVKCAWSGDALASPVAEAARIGE